MSLMAARSTTHSRTTGWDRIFYVGAGACDALTGALLIAVPAETMGVLGIVVLSSHAIHLRFVGVFVACVGLAYFHPWAFPPGPAREQRLRVVLELTAAVRLAVALFIGGAVAMGSLDTPWLLVGTVDAGIALVQLALLAKGHVGPVS